MRVCYQLRFQLLPSPFTLYHSVMLLALGMLISCSTAPTNIQAFPPTPTIMSAAGVAVPFTHLESPVSPANPSTLVIHDQATLQSILTLHDPNVSWPPDDLPTIDFSQEQVILVADGFKSYGPMGIYIVGVFDDEHARTIIVQRHEPVFGCSALTAAAGWPTDMVRLSQTTKPVTFQYQIIPIGCARSGG